MSTPQGECPKCKTPNAYTSVVCNMCGNRLPWAEAVAGNKATPPAAPAQAPSAQTLGSATTTTTTQAALKAIGLTIVGVVLALIIFSALVGGGDRGAKYSKAQYDQLQTGMSYSQAATIMGDPGEQSSRVENMGIILEGYSWANDDGTSCNAQFQNDRLLAKAQLGLR